VLFPAWLAVTVQVPAPVKTKVFGGVSEQLPETEYVIVNPESVVAVSDSEDRW
jgi:hypothetical protein